MQVDSEDLNSPRRAKARPSIDQAVTDYLDYRTTASGHVKAALERDHALLLRSASVAISC
jgi:hypothetical protein